MSMGRMPLSPDSTPKAILSSDAGQTWDTISYNIPYAGINQLIFEGNQDDGIFAATNVGVFYLGKDEETWVRESRNMPAVDVRELEIQFDTIYAATYGRGVWKAPIDNVGEVYGCTDPKAHNYNSEATFDNGTCQTCDDLIINGGERWFDCGSACNNNCRWEVYFNFDGNYFGTLRIADSLAMDGDTILFINEWLVNDTIEVASPEIDMLDRTYWKVTQAQEIKIMNAEEGSQAPLLHAHKGIETDGFIFEGKNGGKMILQLASGAALDIKSGGIGRNAEIQMGGG